MSLPVVYRYLHVLSAMLFAAAILGAHMSTLVARRAGSWAERAVMFDFNRRLGLFFAVPGLLVAGIVGQLLAMSMGYSMSGTPSFQIANGMWLLLVIVTFVLDVPQSARLARLARSAAAAQEAREPAEWAALLGRWRIGNAAQLLLFLAMLWVMVAPWQV